MMFAFVLIYLRVRLDTNLCSGYNGNTSQVESAAAVWPGNFEVEWHESPWKWKGVCAELPL